MKYILKKNCRDDFVDELFTMMDDDGVAGGDDDGPETSNRVLRPTGADNINKHHADYENRIPVDPDPVEAAINHNKAHPVMINELNNKKSLADAGMKKNQRDRECNFYDTNCKACVRLMFWRELSNIAFDPKCRACMKLKAWRDNGELKPPCKLHAVRPRPKQNGRITKYKNVKKLKRTSYSDRKSRNVLAINDSKIDMVDEARLTRKPKRRERECDSCSSVECSHKKKKPAKKDSDCSSKVSLGSDRKSRNDSKTSFQDYGELDDEPMV